MQCNLMHDILIIFCTVSTHFTTITFNNFYIMYINFFIPVPTHSLQSFSVSMLSEYDCEIENIEQAELLSFGKAILIFQ